MKFYSKYMPLLAAIVLITFLSACDKAEKNPNTVKIAAILPISGSNASFGIGMMNSAKLAVDTINESGRLGELKLALLELDDESKPGTARNVATKAANDANVVASIGHWNSGCARASNPIFHQYKLANIVPGAVNSQITLGNDYPEILRIVPHDITQNDYAARYAVKLAKKQRIFLINDNTTYGNGMARLFAEYATKYGAEIIGEESINVGDRDFSAILTKIKTYQPDYIFFGGVVTEAGLIRRQMAELGLDIGFQSGSGIISNAFIEVAGSAAEGTISTHFAPPVSYLPGGVVFAQNYQQAQFNNPHESYGPHTYAAIEVIAQAIERVGADRAKIITELHQGEFDSLLGKVSFDANGQTELITMGIYQVIQGKWQLLYYTDADAELEKI